MARIIIKIIQAISLCYISVQFQLRINNVGTHPKKNIPTLKFFENSIIPTKFQWSAIQDTYIPLHQLNFK